MDEPANPHFERICRYGVVNCYLVEEADGLTAIDTAVSGTSTNLLSAAARRGKPINRIVLTHSHSDHVGSLDALAAELPDAEVVISAREARLLGGDKSLLADEPADKVKGGFPKIATEPTRTVEAGERIGSLEVIAAPGHTPGQIALLDSRDRTLFCGDAFHSFGGVNTVAKMTLRFPLPYLATWHKPTALESARSLTALAPARLAPGHGKVIEDPVAAMERAITAAS